MTNYRLDDVDDDDDVDLEDDDFEEDDVDEEEEEEDYDASAPISIFNHPPFSQMSWQQIRELDESWP